MTLHLIFQINKKVFKIKADIMNNGNIINSLLEEVDVFLGELYFSFNSL